MDKARIGAIGEMLQGIGAGFNGTLPQLQYARQQQQEAEFLNDERRRKALIQDFTSAYVMAQNGQWDTATRLLANRHENIVRLGGDPSDTAGLLQAMSDPARREEALGELGSFYAAGVASGQIEPMGGGGMASAKTRQYVDGTVQMVMPDGSIQVVLPDGQQVHGEDARAALQQAMANEVSYAGQKSGAMAQAQQGAQYQYAAPIAGAQAQARADVEAATAPQIAADVTAAKTGAAAATERTQQQRSNSVALDTYNAAMAELETSLGQTATGPVAGRLPAITAKAQIAEGAGAAIAPVLKQLFRSAGEGVFTDKDQQLLMEMVPKRTDHPETIAAKKANIDAIVRAKLGGSPSELPPAKPSATPATAQTGGVKFLGFE